MIYRFGGYAIDDARRELRRGGEPIAIEPKAFALLCYLVARSVRVVRREELVAALWPHENVTPSSLTFCVNRARRAVGDDGMRQSVIRNARGHGYQFVAECSVSPTPETDESWAPLAAARQAASGFVGRAPEMAALERALRAAIRGVGGVVLLSGEAGIGKTRTAEELATLARDIGVHVLVGRSYEGQESPAFWPWLQMIRADLPSWQPAQLRTLLGSGAADIACMLPAVRNFLPDIPEAVPQDMVQSRFRLFDSLAGYFKAVAAWQPLLVILDDLHWADRSSLALLRFVVEELPGERVLLVGTYRDCEVGPDQPVSAVAAALKREGALHLQLRGLDAEAAHELIAQGTAGAMDPQFAEDVVRATEGNPLFVIEMTRHLDDGRDARWTPGRRLPDTVEDLIERRLQGLDEDVRATLLVASVCGREFSLHMLEQLLVPLPSDLFVQLAKARRGRVIEDVPGVPDRHRFVHALYRESLYASLPHLARARYHVRIADCLEQVGSDNVVPEVAQHALAALPVIELSRAVDAAVRAAQHALDILAYEQAVHYCQLAVSALDRSEAPNGRSRCRVLLVLGEAYSRLGDTASSRGAFDQAADIARRDGLRRALGLAALRGSGGMVQPVVLMQDQVAALEEALAELGDDDPVLRSRLLSRLALALYYHRDGVRSRRLTMTREAIHLAKRQQSDEALYWALVSRHWAEWGPKGASRRLAVADALVRLGEKRAQRALVLRAQTYRVGALLELARVDEVDEAIALCEQLAGELRIPMFLWTVAYFRAMRTLMHGDFVTAQRLANEAVAQGSGEAGEDSSAHVFGIQVCAHAFFEGKMGELEPLLLAYREQRPDMPFLECALAAIYAEAGRTDEAGALLESLAPHRFRRIPQDNLWMTGIVLLGTVAARLGDRRRGSTLFRILAPYDGLLVTCGNAVATMGPMAQYLGILAKLDGRQVAARRYFEESKSLADTIGLAPVFTAVT